MKDKPKAFLSDIPLETRIWHKVGLMRDAQQETSLPRDGFEIM